MSRRTCLPLLAASFALAVPSASLAQSSSQAQYQGVAPETQTPVTGSGNIAGGGGTTGGSAGSSDGSGSSATGTGGSSQTGGATSGASGNGGGGASAQESGGTKAAPAVSLPKASSDTSPFSGGDIVLVVVALAALAGLGLVLRRSTRAPAGA
jgi:cobalamin biosynthesis Mg chelatase CobN